MGLEPGLRPVFAPTQAAGAASVMTTFRSRMGGPRNGKQRYRKALERCPVTGHRPACAAARDECAAYCAAVRVILPMRLDEAPGQVSRTVWCDTQNTGVVGKPK